MSYRHWYLFPALLTLAGCVLMSAPGTRALSRGPAGATLAQMGGVVIVGELLAVEDTAIVVRLVNGTLAIGSWRSLPPLRVVGLGRSYRMDGTGAGPDDLTRRRIAAVSRFPQGLRPEWAAILLADAGQTSFGLLVGPEPAAGPGREGSARP